MVADGEQAVQACREARFDVVLMDLSMPVLDGLTATEQIRRRYPTDALPIIAVTADAYQQTRRDCLEAGLTDLLVKPFTPAELRAAVASANTRREPAPELVRAASSSPFSTVLAAR